MPRIPGKLMFRAPRMGNADWDSESSQAEAACNLAWAMKVDCVESAARVELTDAIQTRNVQLENDTPPLLHR